MSKFWRKTGNYTLCSILIAGGVSHANSPDSAIKYQDLESVKTAVHDAVVAHTSTQSYMNLNVSIRSIDGRLRLKECSEPIAASVTNPTQRLGRLTTEVSCNGETPWKIYVQATASADAMIPVPIRSLTRGTVISETDIELRPIPVGSMAIAESIDSIIGMELRRTIGEGKPILLSHLAAPELVQRGQKVNIRYDNSDLRITVAGKALQNGASGEWISIENSGSGRRIEGRVNNDGSVTIPKL